MSDMAGQLAMNVEWVEEAAASNNILSLQTGKIDLTFGLSVTPTRALAIDFTSPLFNHPFGIIGIPGFTAKSWADINKPTVKIAVNIGTSEELAARLFAPKAQISGFKSRDDLLLAVSSKRVDCGVFAALLGMVAAKRNPNAGRFMLLSNPAISLPSCMGVRKERDARWRELVNACVAYYRGTGQIQKWYEDALKLQGINPEDIPDGVFNT
jgi:polar amino acid transport system substrate-binding protein